MPLGSALEHPAAPHRTLPHSPNKAIEMRNRSETLTVGEQAPDFTLPTNRGDRQSLASYLARGPVLLAFHRGTW